VSSSGTGGLGSVVAETSSSGFTINLIFDSAAMAAPASFRAGIEQAASILSATITNKITVNIGIDYSGTGGGAAAGPDNGQYVSYSTVRADLIADATPDDASFNALPTGSTIQGQSQVAVWNAQLKLFGLISANDTTTDDGSATFSTDINPNLLVGVALHELTHAIGRVPYGPQPDIFDFYRFTGVGTRLFTDNIPSSSAYFSLDGGNTKLADFGVSSDPSDFLNPPNSMLTPNDAFNEFYSGTTLQSLTTVDKEMLDALGFSLATPVTLSVTSDAGATAGEHIALSSLVSVSDPGGVGYQTLELWDSKGTVAGGQFVVNGAAESGGHEIDVSPANVANTVFDAGTQGGTDILWARLLQNDGTLTAWQQFDVSTPAPTLTVTSDASATAGQHIALSSLVSLSDPGSVGYQTLELWDSNGTAAGGQFVVNGVAESGGHEIDVSPANVANTVFDAGTLGGTDILWARLLQNDGTLTAWQQFDVSVPTPTLTVTSDASATAGQHIAVSSLVSLSDPGSIGYQTLELWDSNGTAAGGQFVVNGVAESGGHEIDVSPANVANTVFDAGTQGGTDILWARLLEDNGTLTAWQQLTVGVPASMVQVAATQTSLSASGTTLALNSPSTFDGQIIGFTGDGTLADSDQIDLRGLNYSSMQSNFDSSSGVLAVNDGKTSANLQFLGQYSQNNFLFANDGDGGTIVYGTASAGQIGGAGNQAASTSSAGAHDNFVFASNFGQATIANFAPATDTFEFSKTVFANINALLKATHDNASGNAVITDAAHDTITIQHVTTAQLIAHQSDFHFV